MRRSIQITPFEEESGKRQSFAEENELKQPHKESLRAPLGAPTYATAMQAPEEGRQKGAEKIFRDLQRDTSEAKVFKGRENSDSSKVTHHTQRTPVSPTADVS